LLIRQIFASKLLVIIIIGLTIRLVLAPFTSYPFDVYIWYTISTQISNGGTIGTTGIGYIPMLYYTLVPISYTYSHLVTMVGIKPTPVTVFPVLVRREIGSPSPLIPVSVLPDPLFNLLVKIPSIIADLFSALIIYDMILARFGKNAASNSFILWFLNPMLVWISAVWGQYDSLPALFTLLSTYFMWKKKFYLSGITLAIAIGYKVYPILLAIPLFYYAYKTERSGKKLILPLLVFVTALLLLFFPWIASGFNTKYYGFYTPIGNPSTHPQNTYGLTYWSIAPFTPITGPQVLITFVSILVLAFLVVTLLMLLKTKHLSLESLCFWELAFIATIFLSYPTVNEQWFIWLLPFLTLLFGTKIVRLSLVVTLSMVSLFYSFINSQIAPFFVRLYLYDPAGFTSFVESVHLINPQRLILMGVLGIAFSVLLLLTLCFSFKRSLETRDTLPT
jgi:hypothetical protein